MDDERRRAAARLRHVLVVHPRAAVRRDSDAGRFRVRRLGDAGRPVPGPDDDRDAARRLADRAPREAASARSCRCSPGILLDGRVVPAARLRAERALGDLRRGRAARQRHRACVRGDGEPDHRERRAGADRRRDRDEHRHTNGRRRLRRRGGRVAARRHSRGERVPDRARLHRGLRPLRRRPDARRRGRVRDPAAAAGGDVRRGTWSAISPSRPDARRFSSARSRQSPGMACTRRRICRATSRTRRRSSACRRSSRRASHARRSAARRSA